ncbi:methyltransferase-like protein 6 isoform X4 [Durio zibethinus]|uniref:tRNA N(3)-methylcytidine methyltransferase n=1 Tax=Durio zibethinus TaxID=66656 RepID=A0A6P5Z1H2_DURZI|nr:methyltransferase-like protein 6 isoform X4 [Durio zibethinus]
MSVSKAEASEYHSKDFNWETLRQEIENDPSLNYHLLPFNSPQPEEQHSNDSIKAWQNFHVQHSSGKFFKERRYLLKEFPELVSCADGSKVLEVGCGNGSTALPILREMFSCKDQNCLSDVGEKRTHETDSLSMEERSCCVGGVDFVTLIFTLSAVPLQTMPTAIRECFSVLKPGGLLLFRDYGLYDMTMLRFESDQRVGFREYMRSDGTRSYFFCLDTARNLFISAGFIELEIEYCCVKSVNRRNGESMRRVWVHGKFQKP